jgi:hypothetical protein
VFDSVVDVFTAQELWTQGSHEGFESLMSEAMLRAFKDTHDEYKKHNVEMDYVSRPCESAQIMRVQFMQDETTEKDLAWVDVQFVNEQRITLRDSTGKVIGDEGEFTKKVRCLGFRALGFGLVVRGIPREKVGLLWI